MENQQNNVAEEENNVNLRELLEKYLYYWKWILFSMFCFLGLAFVYLRYSRPIYEAEGLLLIEEDKKGSVPSEIDIFKDLGVFGGTSNLNNEIQILKSKRLINRVIDTLRLQVSYQILGERTGFQSAEYYKERPISLLVIDSLINDKNGIDFELNINSAKDFNLNCIVEEKTIQRVTGKFGTPFKTNFGMLELVQTSYFDNQFVGRTFELEYRKNEVRIDELSRNLTVESVNKDASVISIKYKGPVKDKNEAIINELIRQHEIDKIAAKNEIAAKTSAFIDERMNFVAEELALVDNKNLKFKKENNLIDVETDAKNTLLKENEIEKRVIEMGIQLELAKSVYSYIDKKENLFDVLPSNLGFEDRSIAEMIAEYNKLVLERIKLISGSNQHNPVLIQIESQINVLKKSLISSLANVERWAETELKKLQTKASIYSQELGQIPDYEKEYKDILRQQQIKETLYLYLMEKREENEIALHANVSNAKIVDDSYSFKDPVSPKRKFIYLGALFLGLILPLVIIYLKDLFDTKVKTPRDIEGTGLMFLGSIPHSDENEKIIALSNPRSAISEAFRFIRTNLSFLATNENSKVIFVTSTISGEGKTFFSLNIAHSLTMSGKKIVVVGLDLRAPKLARYLEIAETRGVSDLLVNKDLSLDEVISTNVSTDGLDVLLSGSIPPNPSELLVRQDLVDLINELRNRYDYVIVDTAPVSLVTDTVSVNHLSDVNIYVCRAGKIDKRMLKIPYELTKSGKIKNMGIVLNDVDFSRQTYGYGYGYGYGLEEPKKSFLKKVFSKRK